MASPRQINAADFSKDVLDLLRALEKHAVEYVIAGGVAVVFHGYPRSTGDIDFFFARTGANAERLFAALQEFWAGGVPGIHAPAELLNEDEPVIQFGREPNRIDLLNKIDGIDFAEAWSDHELAEVVGPETSLTVRFLSRSALLKNKIASGRLKDLNDVEQLE